MNKLGTMFYGFCILNIFKCCLFDFLPSSAATSTAASHLALAMTSTSENCHIYNNSLSLAICCIGRDIISWMHRVYDSIIAFLCYWTGLFITACLYQPSKTDALPTREGALLMPLPSSPCGSIIARVIFFIVSGMTLCITLFPDYYMAPN